MRKSEFKYLESKIAFKVVIKIICFSFISMIGLVFLVDFLFNDWLANFVTSYIDWGIYNYFVNNKILVLLFMFVILVFVVSFFVIRNANNYLYEILLCMNDILNDENKDIKLSEDLSILENSLNDIRKNFTRAKNSEREAINKKNDLIMYMAHDLKTPLTSVIGYLSLLNDEKDINSNTKEKYIKIALDKAFRLEDLTNQFFEITKYDLSEMPLVKKDLDLSFLTDQLIDECYPMLQEKNLKIIAKKKDGIHFYGDGDMLARAFLNLIKNAISYSYSDSSIEINIDVKDNKIIMTFKNECDEIPKYKLDKLFDKFYRGNESRNSSSGGSGLGLHISREIIIMHGGEINVRYIKPYIIFTIILDYI